MPLRAIEDTRSRGEFLGWRDRLAATGKREADYAFSVLARILSWAYDRRTISVNPCERPGRLYSGSRAASIWSEAPIEAFTAAAPSHVALVFLIALWTGQRQGDVLRLTWSAYDGQVIRLRQTATTDAIAGGHAVGQEHRQVQADIERADAKALAAILNRDLIRPWIDLEFGPQRRYPRLVIARPEPEDLKALTEALGILVPLGLRVEASEVRDKLKLSEPAAGAEILGVAASAAPQAPSGGTSPQQTASLNGVGAFFKRGAGLPATFAGQSEQAPSAAISERVDPIAVMTELLAGDAQPEIRRMLEQIEAMLTAAGSFDEFREMLRTGFPDIDSAGLGEQLGRAMVAAHVAGRAAVEEDDA